MSESTLPDDETLVRFLSSATPRVVPESLRRAALREAAPLALAVFGGVFLLMGLVFLKLFFPWRQMDDWRLAAGPAVVTEGRVVAVDYTRMEINKIRVMRYVFEFTPAGGEPVSGVCFTTGSRWEAGATAAVRNYADEPELACLVGARLSEGGLGSAFVLLFPLVGGGLVGWVIVARRRAVALLVHGALGEFRVGAITATGATMNEKPYFKVCLEPIDLPGVEPVVVRWYDEERLAFVRGRKERGVPVLGLFDRAWPKQVLLPEAWLAKG